MLFIAAGLWEIGGGYLVWLWLRSNRGILLGAVGGLVFCAYGSVRLSLCVTEEYCVKSDGGIHIVNHVADAHDP
ncbi:MAG: hypothetical protein AABN34_29400 [Acidobacteriota bacterium]